MKKKNIYIYIYKITNWQKIYNEHFGGNVINMKEIASYVKTTIDGVRQIREIEYIHHTIGIKQQLKQER